MIEFVAKMVVVSILAVGAILAAAVLGVLFAQTAKILSRASSWKRPLWGKCTQRVTAVFTMICLWACLLPVTVSTTGCNQSELAALANTLGNAGASIAAIEGNTALATKIQTDTAAAVTAITNWKSGTNAQMALEAIQLVEDDLNLLPINSAYEPLILLALGTAASIIAILNPTAVSAHMPGQRTVTLSNPPKTAKAFKAQWNAICVQHGLSVAI